MKHLLVLLALLAPATVAAQDPAEEKRARLAYFASPLEPVVTIDKKGNAGAALAVYEDWARGASAEAAMPRDVMARMYQAAGGGDTAFKTVAHLIKSGEIPEGHSISMARVREAEIVRLVKNIAGENGWKIARSDSGNVTSGMKSDLDQTFYVFEKVLDENGKPVLQEDGTPVFERKAELDGAFIEEFERRWDAELEPLGLSRQALDVASIEGRNRFPDPRQTVQGGFWRENRRATEALRNTPGAYTYAGAVAHQMQFRAMQAILEGNERAYQIFAPGPDGEVEYRGTDPEEGVRTMFGDKPDLRPTFAFDAALANFLELQHYMRAEKFETKYHLRTWEDSLHSLMLAEEGKGRDSKVDLIKIGAARRKSLVFKSLNRLFPDDPIKRRRHALAMEISAKQRLVHKDELSIADRELFDEFGKAVLGKEWDGSEGAIADVRREYRRVASEFCLEASYHASGEALALLVGDDPKNQLRLEQYREILGFKDVPDAEWNATLERLKDATQLTFLFGIYDLGYERSKELMTRLASDRGLRVAPYLFGLWLRGTAQGIESHLREPGRYAAIYAEKYGLTGEAMARRTREYVLGELGFRHEAVIDRVTGELTGRQLIWDGKVVARNMVYDPGNLDAFAQIIKAYILSEGDWEVALATMADEFILALPVVGQVVGATRGGVGGLAIMGAAMAYPPIGGVLIAVSLAEAGYAIYDAEYARPVADQVENAIYRGYIGPELRYYDKPPPKFTKDDAKELAALKARLASSRPDPHFTPPYTYDLQTLRNAEAAHRKKLADHAALVKELGPMIAALEAKQEASRRYLRDPSAGGGFFGFGARLEQRAFGPSLLAAVEPVISFSPYGFIDFRARQDPEELARLEAAKGDVRPAEEQTAFEVELRRARVLRARELRAERYRQRATGSVAVDDEERPDEPQTSLELRHKIRRDSLYPALLELGIEDPDVYFDRWFEANAGVMDRLVDEGLLFNDIGEEYLETPAGPIVTYNRRSPLNADSKRKLRARFRGDHERSKALWEAFQEIEKNRILKDEQDLARRDSGLEGVAAGLAVDEVYRDPTLARVYQAMRGEKEPTPGVPQFSATVYRTEDGIECGFTLRCDALQYPPPYKLDMRTVGIKDAWRAAKSGRMGPITLTPAARRSIRETLKQEPEKNTDDINVILVTCFDSLGDMAGQSLSIDFYEGEPEIDLVISGTGNSRVDDIEQMIRARFPEFTGRFDLEFLIGRPVRQALTRFSPVVYEVDFNEIRNLIAYHEGNEPLDLDDAFKPYRGGFRGTVTCNGHTEHFMQVIYSKGRVRSLTSPWIYGLKNGDNSLTVELGLQDGTRLSRTLTVGAERIKPRGDIIANARKNIDEAREKFGEKGDYYSLSTLHNSIGGYVHSYMNGGGLPNDVAGLIEEMASLHQELIRLHGEPRKQGTGKPMRARTGFALVKNVGSRCMTWGTMRAYTTLSKTLEGMRGLPEHEKAVGEESHTELRLGELLLRAGGGAQAARRHFERSDLLRSKGRSAAEIRAELDEYWPEGSFWN